MDLAAICIHNFRKFSQLDIDLSGSVVILGEDRADCWLDTDFSTGSSNSVFQPRRSRAKEEGGAK